MKHPVRSIAIVSIVVVSLASMSSGSGTRPSPSGSSDSGSVGAATHAQMQLDIEMTQRMSTPIAFGPMQGGLVRDSQLQRSRDPGYVLALERHQADIDRMLARNP